MTPMAGVLQGRLFRFWVAYVVGYGLLAWSTAAPTLILLLNGIAMSVAAGVCVAYAPMLPEALRAPSPSRGDFLGSGIFAVSLAVFGMRVLSFVARDLGRPEVYNMDWTTSVIAIGILGGLHHLWAPNAVEGRVPRRKWVGSGALVALGLFLAFLAWFAHARIGTPPIIELK